MTINYFRLKNFAGIKYGINQNELILKDIPNGIIMLKGDNGSGKSTTLHTLHIFSDDKSFLIKNDNDDTYEPAEKELIITHNKNTYRILHQYSNKGTKKSFISKNGEEMNKNGNVSTFENYIYDEFKIDNNKISNNVIGVSQINFIDLSSSERKKEISTLLPNISEYEKHYKIANDALNACKKQIQYLSNIIAENGGSDEINKQIKIIKDTLTPLTQEITTIENNIKSIEEDYITKKTKLDNLNDNINTLHSKINTMTEMYNNYLNKVNRLSNENIKEKDINILYENKNSLLSNISNLKVEQQKTISKLNQLNADWATYTKQKEDQQNITNIKNNLNTEISNLEKEINLLKIEYDKHNNIKIKNYYNQNMLDNIINIGKSIKEELESINNVYTIQINEYSIFYLYNNINILQSKIENFNKQQQELMITESYIKLFNSMVNNTNNSELSNITLTDGCSFNKCANQYSSLLTFYKSKYEKLFNFINNNQDKYNQCVTIVNIYHKYRTTYDYRKQILTNLEIDIDINDSNNLSKILDELRLKRDEISKYLFELSKKPDQEKHINSKISQLNNLKQMLTNTKDVIVKEFTEDINNINVYQSEISSISSKIKNMETSIISIDKDIDVLKEYSKLDEMNRYINEYNSIKKEYDNLILNRNELIENIKATENSLNVTKQSLQFRLNNINEYNKNIRELEDRLTIINDHISNRDNIEKDIQNRNYVCQALHSTKGIPSFLIKSYLEIIENICNDILIKTFDGTYKIFIENLEKDFFIRVYEKSTDRYISDVKNCSSGQQAIIKLVLSISLSKCAIGDNIYLRLDEADSVLSKDNLIMVETLLNSLLNRFGIEQVFIVTHNSSVSICDMLIEYDRENQIYKIN